MSEIYYAEVEVVDNDDPRPGDSRVFKWIVKQVVVVPPEQNVTGEKYLTEELGLSGKWYRTELDTGFRKQLASLGGEFIPDFQAPEAYPDGVAPVFEPIQVKEGATGFMIIERSVFEEYQDAHPEYMYKPDHIREGEFKAGEQICAFFDTLINEENRYLSEDYMFSENCRKLGIKIWALPHIELMHSGSYIYQGKIVDMANVGVHATLDPEHAQKILDGKTAKSGKK